MDFVIKPAGAFDILAIRRLERKCFGADAYGARTLLKLMSQPTFFHFKAVQGRKLVGYISGDIRNGGKEAWTISVAVDPEFEGRWLGVKMLARLEEAFRDNGAQEIRAVARKSNRASLAVSRRNGFVPIDEWPNHYADGEAAILVRKELTDSGKKKDDSLQTQEVA